MSRPGHSLQLSFWMNMPSPYQADMLSELASRGVELHVVYAEQLTAERRNLGWASEKSPRFASITLPRRTALLSAATLAWRRRRMIHIVNGIWAEPAFLCAAIVLAFSGARFVIYTEAQVPRRRAALLRIAQGIVGRLITRYASGFLAVGSAACEFMKSLGARPERIYPFGYFRESFSTTLTIDNREGERRVGFVGQLIERKGVDTLLYAFQELVQLKVDAKLSFVGSGALEEWLRDTSVQLALNERVEFRGVLPAEEVSAFLSHVDVLVLPSRWDGWGVVVNEAFRVGTPVVVSDKCGASEIVRDGINGYIFPADDHHHLQECLRKLLCRSDRAEMRRNAAATARLISVDSVAPYLLECMAHMTGAREVRPEPPWCVTRTS